MKVTIQDPSGENIYNLMRRIGYYFQKEDKEREELIFARPSEGYPRFHIFLKKEGENLIFNLHLDQKKPSYKGVTAHSGEYEGETVEKEAERIRQLLK